LSFAADLAQKIAEGMVTASVRNGPDPTTGQTSVHLLDRSSSPLDHLCPLGPLSPYRIVSSSSRISF